MLESWQIILVLRVLHQQLLSMLFHYLRPNIISVLSLLVLCQRGVSLYAQPGVEYSLDGSFINYQILLQV
jgi:hypothetical protein